MSISVKRTVEDADADKPKKPRLEVSQNYITFLFIEIPYVRKELLALEGYSKTCVKQPLKNRQNEDLSNNW